MASALATVHTIRGEPICTSVIGVTLPPRSGSGNLDQHSPSSCIPLHEFLCGCWSRDAIMALLLAGVRTVYRWPTCIVVGWCLYSLQVAYMHNSVVLHLLSHGDVGTFIKTLHCLGDQTGQLSVNSSVCCVLHDHFITTTCCCTLCPENS